MRRLGCLRLGVEFSGLRQKAVSFGVGAMSDGCGGTSSSDPLDHSREYTQRSDYGPEFPLSALGDACGLVADCFAQGARCAFHRIDAAGAGDGH